MTRDTTDNKQLVLPLWLSVRLHKTLIAASRSFHVE
jgi:hypothetical protein